MLLVLLLPLLLLLFPRLFKTTQHWAPRASAARAAPNKRLASRLLQNRGCASARSKVLLPFHGNITERRALRDLLRRSCRRGLRTAAVAAVAAGSGAAAEGLENRRLGGRCLHR